MTDPVPDPAAFGLRPRSPRVCSLDDCDKKHEALGYCRKHYERFKKHGDPNMVKTPARRGRSTVGQATRPIRASKTRGPRMTTPHIQVRLAAGQPDLVRDHADHMAMSGNAVLRAAIARLLAGDIPPPADPGQVPRPALPSQDEWPLIPGVGQLDALAAMATELMDVLLPEGPTGPTPTDGRRGKPDTQARDALVRYALDRHLNTATTED